MPDSSHSEATKEAIAQLRKATDRSATALILMDGLEEEGEWSGARILAEMTLQDPSLALTPAHKAEFAYRAGAAAEVEGDDGAAERWLGVALEAEPGHRGALLAIGNRRYRSGDYEESERCYRTLLARHRDTLDPAIRAEAHFRLAGLYQQAGGATGNAQVALEKALSSLPTHRAARKALIELHRTAAAWEKVAEHQRRLVDLSEGAERREQALIELSDVLRTKLGDLEGVEACYRELAELRRDPRVMTDALDMYDEAGRVADVVRLLAERAQAESGPAGARAGDYLTMARLYRDRLGDTDAAVACFHQSLDFEPSRIDVFEECNALLEQSKDWATIEEHHRRMLARLGRKAAPEIRARLWRALAELYMHKLERPDDAMVALEAAADLQPAESATLEQAALLLEQEEQPNPERGRKLHRRLLAREPERVQSLRALRRIELREGNADLAWLLCGRLAQSGDIQPDEEAFFENLRRAGLPSVSGALLAASWTALVRHPEVDPRLEQVLSVLTPLLLPLYIADARSLGLSAKSRLETDAPLLLVRVVRDLSASMGLEEAPAVHRLTEGSGLSIGATKSASLLVGPEMLAGREHRELAFLVGQQLARLLPNSLLSAYVPKESMPWLVQCVASVFDQGVQVPDDVATRAVLEALETGLSEAQREALAEPILRLLAEGEPWTGLLSRHLFGVDATCDRVALIVSEAFGPGLDSLPTERRSELMGYSISSDHLRLRESLGIAYRLADRE